MLKLSTICLLSCLVAAPSAYAISESESFRLLESITNAAGNTYTGAASKLHDSMGEPVIGQAFGQQYSVQAGLFNNYFLPPPTATPSPTVTVTPLPSIADFSGELIDAKYAYVAPNPTKGEQVYFRFFVKRQAEVQIRIFTPRGKLVMTKDYQMYPQGWNTAVWNAAGMANGVYFYIVEAKTDDVKEKLAVKKIALIK